MSFRSLREQKLLSQEKLSQMSGLSLRTIQRLEAGHRVSYASLRSLAVTLQMDVDALERELYAMKTTSDDFVEIPRWVRRLRIGMFGYGSPPVSRRQAFTLEAVCLVIGLGLLAASFLATTPFAATLNRVGAAFNLVAAYGLSVTTRVIDSYAAWPATETPWRQWLGWRTERTVRQRLFDYSYVVLILLAFFGVVIWLTR
jgi:transcriptional regulator with XRE-family HTH domain